MFLEKVIIDVLKEYSNTPTHEITFVVPNNRAILFLKKYFSKHINKVCISPNFISIGSFMEQISGYKVQQNMPLLFQLYDVYMASEGEEKDDFETFIGWGQTLLQDFSEIDMYLIAPERIFPYIEAVKEIEHWSLSSERTELQQKHLDFWNTLGDYYHDFTQKSEEKKQGYRGFVYRKAVEKVEEYCQKNKQTLHIFAGFNALSKCEEEVIKKVLSETKSEIYWDIDQTFIEDKQHDAGLFIREYFKWSYYYKRPKKWIESNFSSPKNIQFIGVPKHINQAHYTAEYFKKNSVKNWENTALILADESLLLPVIQYFNGEIPVNITMGYPLKQTPLNDFFLAYFKLYVSDKWYYKDVKNLLTQPHLQGVLSKEYIDQILNEIRSKNWVYLFKKQLVANASESDQKILNVLFLDKEFQTSEHLITHCFSLISILKQSWEKSSQKNALLLEYLYRFYQLFNQLYDLQIQYSFLKTPKTLWYLYNDLLNRQTLDFQGEPLQGLQLMGLLESQNLDFENVIILSVNEGILPTGKSGNSFIPFDVKREIGLPTYKHRDAIFAYHFYRLIQRAKSIQLVYNTETDSLKGSEKSRFLLQLKAFKLPNFQLEEKVLSPRVNAVERTQIVIEKSEKTMQRLNEIAQNKGFSPTALTSYIRNPIDFYLQHILKIRQEKEVQEVIENRTFGDIVHKTLENLYTPLVGKIITPEDVENLRKNVPKEIEQSFIELYREEDYNSGKNFLIFNVIKEYVLRFLQMDKKLVRQQEVKILALEHKFRVKINHQGNEIVLNGTADRIEQRNGQLHIIDFKTGIVQKNDVKLNDEKWNLLSTDFKYSKAFQLLMYAYMASIDSEYSHYQNVMVGNFSFKRMEQGLITFAIDKENSTPINAQILARFEEKLIELLSEIFNPDIPFMEKEV